MKYALVDNNQIKVGPRDYHVGFFLDYLQNNNVSYDLPSLAPSSSFEINETISIVLVEEPSQPSYHPITEQLSGPFYDINTTLITSTYNVVDVPIDSARNKMKELLAKLRYEKENTNIKVTLQDTELTINTNRGTNRDFYVQSYLLMADNDTKLIKFPNDNVWLTLTKSEVGSIVTAINNTVQNAFDWENQQLNIVEVSGKDELNAQYENIISVAQHDI